MTVGDVNSFVPDDHRWYRAEDIPVPVDSAVIGVNHDRYIYLVGGRSKSGPVNNVQVYDAEKNTWSQATPLPGTPVYGHAGGLADDVIVSVDGARKNTAAGNPYVASDECWMGKIDHKDPEQDRMEQAASASRARSVRHRGRRRRKRAPDFVLRVGLPTRTTSKVWITTASPPKFLR